MFAAALSARLATDERGFAVVELVVAVVVLTIGVLALVTTFDSSRGLANSAEKRDTASAIGQRELERVAALPWTQIAHSAAPAGSSNPADPASFMSGGSCGDPSLPASSPCYQWDWSDSTRVEPLVIDSANADPTPNPQSWTTPAPSGGTRLSGDLYRFITWVKDPTCTASTCGGANDYKRITVGVTVNGTTTPVVFSTLVRNSAGGTQNPLTNPGTTCSNGYGQVPCAQ
jgi:Tfp pilus assembly protein PilV